MYITVNDYYVIKWYQLWYYIGEMNYVTCVLFDENISIRPILQNEQSAA